MREDGRSPCSRAKLSPAVRTGEKGSVHMVTEPGMGFSERDCDPTHRHQSSRCRIWGVLPVLEDCVVANLFLAWRTGEREDR